MPCTVDIKNKRLYVKFYSIPSNMFYEKLEQVRSIPSYDRRFLKEEKAWEICINEKNIQLLKEYGFEFINEAKKLLGEDFFKLPERYLPEIDKKLLDDKLYPFQIEGVRFLEGRNGRAGIFDQMGCIDGEAIIQVNRAKESRKYKLKDLYMKFNELEKTNKWNRNIKTYSRCYKSDMNRIGLNEIEHIIYKGKKKVLFIKTKLNKSIKLTSDHELLTDKGWIEAGKLSIGDFIFVNGYNVCKKCITIPKLEKIIIKEELKEKIDVYDIIMKDPYRNFIANNIIVHNCGKTIQSLMYLKIHPELRPALIVCPAILKLNWKKEIDTWLKGEKIEILQGKSFYEINNQSTIIIINYEILGKTEIIEKEMNGKKKKVKVLDDNSWCYYLDEIGIKIIIADECQRISGFKNICTKAFKKIKREKFIPLSGTPIKNNPAEFFTILNILDSITFNNRYSYLQKFCNPKFNGFGWTYKGLSNGDELYKLIYPLMIRREKKEVLKELPEKTTIIVPLECNKEKMDEYYEMYKKIFDKKIKNKMEIRNEMELLKQLAYAAKRNFVIDWIKNFLESEEKLVLFAVHIKVLDDLEKEFKNICVRIDGSVGMENRQKIIEDFQNKKKTKLFLGQIRATGEGITLTASSNVVHVELDWNPATHDQASDRCHRISQKAQAVFIYYLIANNTIENDIIELLQEKGRILGNVLDGKEGEFFNNDILEDLIRKNMNGL